MLSSDDMQVMAHTQTRQKLIKAGGEIIAMQGFNNAGINSVLGLAGVPKGSFYHYFTSKQDFGLAIIDDFATDYSSLLVEMLNDDRFAPLQRLRNYLENCLDILVEFNYSRGCMIGNLSQELAAQNSVFRERLAEVFDDWKLQHQVCLEAAIEAGELEASADCGQLAEFLLSGCQGAMLRSKVEQSSEPMRNFIEIVFSRVLQKAG